MGWLEDMLANSEIAIALLLIGCIVGLFALTYLLYQGRVKYVLGKRHGIYANQSFVFYFLATVVVVLTSFVSFLFWARVATDVPYIDDYVYNLLFISLIVIVLASIVAYAMAAVKTYAGRMKTE